MSSPAPCRRRRLHRQRPMRSPPRCAARTAATRWRSAIAAPAGSAPNRRCTRSGTSPGSPPRTSRTPIRGCGARCRIAVPARLPDRRVPRRAPRALPAAAAAVPGAVGGVLPVRRGHAAEAGGAALRRRGPDACTGSCSTAATARAPAKRPRSARSGCARMPTTAARGARGCSRRSRTPAARRSRTTGASCRSPSCTTCRGRCSCSCRCWPG